MTKLRALRQSPRQKPHHRILAVATGCALILLSACSIGSSGEQLGTILPVPVSPDTPPKQRLETVPISDVSVARAESDTDPDPAAADFGGHATKLMMVLGVPDTDERRLCMQDRLAQEGYSVADAAHGQDNTLLLSLIACSSHDEMYGLVGDPTAEAQRIEAPVESTTCALNSLLDTITGRAFKEGRALLSSGVAPDHLLDDATRRCGLTPDQASQLLSR